MKVKADYTNCKAFVTDPHTEAQFAAGVIREHNKVSNTIMMNTMNFSSIPKDKVKVLIHYKRENHQYDGIVQRGYIKSVLEIPLTHFELKESRQAQRFRISTGCEAYDAFLPPTVKDDFNRLNNIPQNELSYELAVTRVLPRFNFILLDLSASGVLIKVDTHRVYVGTTFNFRLTHFAEFDMVVTARIVRLNAVKSDGRELGCVFLTSEKVPKL